MSIFGTPGIILAHDEDAFKKIRASHCQYPITQNSRWLSVSQLLERKLDSYSYLFPKIDKSKYEANAPFALYKHDTLHASQEISAYFNDDSDSAPNSARSSWAGFTFEGYVPPNPSIKSKDSLVLPTDQFLHPDSLDDEMRDALPELPRRRKSIPLCAPSYRYSLRFLVSSDTVLPPEYADEHGESTSAAIWLGCTLQYIALSGCLRVHLKRFGKLRSEIDSTKTVNVFAKICIMPGRQQKQRLRVLDSGSSELSVPSVHFRNISKSELSRLNICVKLYIRRGLLRKPKLVHEWSISLKNVDKNEQQTAWERIERSN